MLNKIMKLIFLVLFIITFLQSCDTTEPPPTEYCKFPEGNRNFTWRMDTVAWFPSTVAGVWAFSDNDAYVMGTIIDGKPPYNSRIGRHWNGSIWEDNINGTFGYGEDISIIPRNDVTGDDHFMVSVGYGAPTGIISAGIAEFNNLTKKWKSYELQAVGELRTVWTNGSGFFIAAGDNGMIYTKDGYSSGWVYSKAPTDFNITRIVGVSKNELYVRAVLSLATGEYFQQIWKYQNNNWIKLLDNQDTTGTIITIPEAGDEINDIAAFRCSITDSLYLYIVGRESFLFKTKGNSLNFSKENLVSKGLPSASLEFVGRIFLFSPNDYWLTSLRYNIYHWNGIDFQKIEPLSFPYGQLWGAVGSIKKGSSGKIWMILEMGSQVYSVLQGKP